MARTQIYYGGSASGKSVFLAQRAVFDVMNGDRNYLVVREVGRTIRGSVFAEIHRVINQWGLRSLFTINKSEMQIICTNGRQIIFAGLDDIEKLKSLVPAIGSLTDIWVEEATETKRNTVKQLYKRQRGGDNDVPKRLTMSFNPIMQSHWIYEEYFNTIGWADDQTEFYRDDLSIQKTWYIHNRFLTDDDRTDLENESDTYFYDVYTLGNWGVLGHIIFTNWTVQDLSDMQNQFTERRNGLDFGFSNDPAALSRSHYDSKHKTIYIFNELYERGLTNDVLAGELMAICGSDVIICDSAEPKSIKELQNEGISVKGAIKGKDSVNHGIQWLQQQKVIIDKSCINTQNEFRQYHWKEDKDGNAIRQPIDKNNHIIDATRYAYEDDSLQSWYFT
jgi:phage terminase large subunit